jgi:1-acyl-sn-glycerol-3-phosphate acyltransferase
MVVMNHRSSIDIAILLSLFGGRMVSRADLADWPVVGPAARSVGTVFVDRSDSMSGVATIRTMRSLLMARQTINIFPEGGTFADDEVHPFHGGAFVAASGVPCEIVPVGVAYGKETDTAFVEGTFTEHLLRMSAAPPSRAAVAIGTPLVVAEGARSKELSRQAHAQVSALVQEARQRLEAVGPR